MFGIVAYYASDDFPRSIDMDESRKLTITIGEKHNSFIAPNDFGEWRDH